MKQQPITIISAELPELDFHSNVERTNQLRLELLSEGYSIVGIKRNSLTGFIVVTNSPASLVKIAKKYEQSSIFFSDVDRNTFEINCMKPRKKINLGKLKRCDKIVQDKKLQISFVEDGKQYNFNTEL